MYDIYQQNGAVFVFSFYLYVVEGVTVSVPRPVLLILVLRPIHFIVKYDKFSLCK